MNIDILATITNNDGVYDDEGNVITPNTILQGFHINSTSPLKDLSTYLTTPTTPRRLFAGVKTYCYKFESEEQAKELLNYSVDEDGNGSYNSIFELPKEPVPESVTKRQARQQTIIMGISEQVQTMIDSIEDPLQRALVDSFWNDSTVYERNHPQMIALSSALVIDEDSLDDMFIAAGKL